MRTTDICKTKSGRFKETTHKTGFIYETALKSKRKKHQIYRRAWGENIPIGLVTIAQITGQAPKKQGVIKLRQLRSV